jgi:hypothetical protein
MFPDDTLARKHCTEKESQNQKGKGLYAIKGIIANSFVCEYSGTTYRKIKKGANKGKFSTGHNSKKVHEKRTMKGVVPPVQMHVSNDYPSLYFLPIIYEHPIGPAEVPGRNIDVKESHHVSWSRKCTTHILPVKGDDELTEIRKWNDVWMTYPTGRDTTLSVTCYVLLGTVSIVALNTQLLESPNIGISDLCCLCKSNLWIGVIL